MCDVSHPDPLPRDAAVSADGVGGAAAAQELEPVRHGPCGIPPAADVARATGGRVRVVLPAAVLAFLDLAASAAGRVRGAGVPRDVVSLQTLEPVLALSDSHAADGSGLAAARREHAAEASAIPPRAGGNCVV